MQYMLYSGSYTLLYLKKCVLVLSVFVLHYYKNGVTGLGKAYGLKVHIACKYT